MNAKNRAAFLALSAVFLAGREVVAQGCASCYTTAAAGGAQTIHALRNGILVLLFPPALMFLGLVLLVRAWSAKSGASSRLPGNSRSPAAQDLVLNAPAVSCCAARDDKC